MGRSGRTVGNIIAEPGATNVIPGAAQVSLDVRHAHDSARTAAVEEMLAKADAIARRRKIELQHARQMDQPAVPMDEWLTACLAEAIEGEGIPVKRMTSGAGHDAMVMAARVPTAMLFLRSPGGVSHHPAETVLQQDVEDSLRVGHRFLRRLAAHVSKIG
jgi:allantoate deiminase